MKTFPCLVAFEGYDWRNEFRVKSVATGKTVTLSCNGKWGAMSAELLALVKKYDRGEGLPWSGWPTYPEQLTADLMREIKELSK